MSKARLASEIKAILKWKARINPETNELYTFKEIASGPLAHLSVSGGGLHYRVRTLPRRCPACYQEVEGK